jgi:hypothetical protein
MYTTAPPKRSAALGRRRESDQSSVVSYKKPT